MKQAGVAGVDGAMVLDVDRNVAASGAYQDVGCAGSTCSPGDAASSTNTQSEAAQCPQLSHDRCPKGDAFVESRLYVGGRLEWFCGFDEIELDSPRASFGHIRTERPNRRRFRRHQRLTPVVALRIHRPEVRS